MTRRGSQRRFGGWVAVGVAAFGAEVALLALLHQGLAWPLWLASALAAVVALLARFPATDRWVFGYARLRRRGRSHGAAARAFVVSRLVPNGAAGRWGVSFVLAALLALGGLQVGRPHQLPLGGAPGAARAGRRPVTDPDGRHGVAVHERRAGVPLSEVQAQLGHTRIDTITITTRLTKVERRRYADRVAW